MKPYITIIWLNYNSRKIIKVVRESLSAIKGLDYPNCELIVIDNGSTDNSFKQVIEYLGRIKLKANILRSNRNLGFTGGNNLGYRYRNPYAKYVALINSDLIPNSNSLTELVDHMESDEETGAMQGIILNYDMTKIDSSGDYLDEALRPYSKIEGCSTKERYITYADGSYCIIKVDAVRRIQGEYLFDEELFAYFEDPLLGVKLWNYGYKVKSIPIIVGRHLRGPSSETQFKSYQTVKNRTALHQVVYTKFGNLYFYRTLVLEFLYSLLSVRSLTTSSYVKALKEGFMTGSMLRRKGIMLNLYKAPYVKFPVLKTLLTPRRKLRISVNDIKGGRVEARTPKANIRQVSS